MVVAVRRAGYCVIASVGIIVLGALRPGNLCFDCFSRLGGGGPPECTWEEAISEGVLDVRLLPPAQVVFDNESPTLDAEVRNLGGKVVLFDAPDGLVMTGRGSSHGFELEILRDLGGSRKVVAVEPAELETELWDHQEPVKTRFRSWERRLGIADAAGLRVRLQPICVATSDPGIYTCRLVMSKAPRRVSNEVEFTVVRHGLRLPPEVPTEVEQLFGEAYASPWILGASPILSEVNPLGHGIHGITESDWEAKRPRFRLVTRAKEVCEKYPLAVEKCVALNIGNRRILPELFAFSAASGSLGQAELLIDVLGQFRGDVRPAFAFIGTLEDFLAGKDLVRPNVMRATGFRGMWWVSLRNFVERRG